MTVSEQTSSGPAASPLAQAQLVDEVCLRFEAAWQSGGRPRIEDYLAEACVAERLALLQELIRLDVLEIGGLGGSLFLRDALARNVSQ